MHVPRHHPAEAMEDATHARIRRIPPLWVLIVATALSSFALQVLVPAMPGLVHVFGVDYGTVPASLTVYLIGLTVGQLVYGPLSDRFGRRPVLLAGFGLFLVGSAIWQGSSSYLYMLAPYVEAKEHEIEKAKRKGE